MGVDGAVHVDAKAAGEKEAKVGGRAPGRIHHHQGAVGQPQQGERTTTTASILVTCRVRQEEQSSVGAKGESWLPGLSVTHECPGPGQSVITACPPTSTPSSPGFTLHPSLLCSRSSETSQLQSTSKAFEWRSHILGRKFTHLQASGPFSIGWRHGTAVIIGGHED